MAFPPEPQELRAKGIGHVIVSTATDRPWSQYFCCVLVSRSDEVDGTTIEFASFREDADATPFFEGLPDGRCQSRHWGYVLQGRVTFRYADRDEVYEAGDAYYAPPGHIPVVTAGTEVIEFSPADEYAKTQAVLARNLAAARAG